MNNDTNSKENRNNRTHAENSGEKQNAGGQNGKPYRRDGKYYHGKKHYRQDDGARRSDREDKNGVSAELPDGADKAAGAAANESRNPENNGNFKGGKPQENRNFKNSESAEEAVSAVSAAKEPEEAPAPAAKRITDEEEEARRSTPHNVVGVRFKEKGKVYYFDPEGKTYGKDTGVIVDTSRGVEFGYISMPNRDIEERYVVLPLRRVIRAATDEDVAHREDNAKLEVDAYNVCLAKIEERCLDMKLLDVECSFDNTKMTFFFTSESRVDFRELVKDLASVYKTRIELRQIGIRDEAKMMGGLGVCGRPYCCSSFLADFVQVSIKMAKDQELSLNTAKISGACGRLMCCLRYEYDTYVDEIAKTPKVDSIVDTPVGEGVVIACTPLAGMCKVMLSNDQSSVQVFHRDDLTVKGTRSKKKQAKNDGETEASTEDDSPKKAAKPEKPRKQQKKAEKTENG